MTTHHARRIAVAVAFLCGLTACTMQQRHAWLTVFFEGVPPIDGESVPASTTPATNAAQATTSAAPAPTEPSWAVHTPYKDRKCDACHEVGQAQSLKGSQRDICLGCHTNVITGAEALHWPLKKGKCLPCHRPHLSTVPKLLTQPGVALCYTCHTPLNQKATVHEPVRRGRCLACHTAHESPHRGLLKKDAQALCNRCHEPEPMKAVKAHAGAGDRPCLDCHDPHQSAIRGLLRETPEKKEGAP